MEVENEQELFVKENRMMLLPLSARWLLLGLAWSACALLLVARIDITLPEPRTRETANPDQFVADIAYEHLVNLTSIGPRVAGSYENEVLSVAMLVSAVKSIASQASPHNRVELDVHRASGNFSLTFMDGMNNVYRDVQSVVARVSGAGARAGGRTALLLNCHFDTVPDSPGASDDAAGCAVLLETMRVLAASPHPLRHDAIFLFNGAEENILQASHAFITQHKWAKSVRAFINLEACGAGGREVLFQAGPHDPWIMEVYAGAVPHPFASSLAQEIFESGLIPADTDFRIFRDFGRLSGVDLAWSANGYVYHTRLDAAQNVPRAALQRTGDNVLALARGLLSSVSLESEVDEWSRQPVFFDVVGVLVVCARAPVALVLVLVTLMLVLLKLRLNAADANKHLYVSRGAWVRAALASACAALCACACGACAAGAAGALLHALGARLAFYARPALLAPLYVAPALAACFTLYASTTRRAGDVPLRGWWRARAAHDGLALLACAATCACALVGLRSGFLPLLWALLPAGADLAALAAPAHRPLAWAAGAALPLLQTCYLLLNSLYMFVPIMGRAGSGPLPADVMMAVMTSALMLTALSWLLPFVVATRDPHKLVYCLWGVCALSVLAVTCTRIGSAYSAERPQRLMVFHTRRTVHAALAGDADQVDHMYWVPELDPNTHHTLQRYVAGVDGTGAVSSVSDEDCSSYVYCGVPYYLPVLSFVTRSYVLRVPHEPLVQLRAQLAATRLAPHLRLIQINVTRASQHTVLIVSPPPGATLEWSNVIDTAMKSTPWGQRHTYFITLHDARAPPAGGTSWSVQLRVRDEGRADTRVSLATHAMCGAHARTAAHAALARALPPDVAATGWGVDLHLYTL